jgi:hypothetical protein
VIHFKQATKTFIKEFERKIQELGFSIVSSWGGFYTLSSKNNREYFIKVQLFLSRSSLILPDGGRNERITRILSYFKTQGFETGENPDAVIISFRNLQNKKIEYLIIPCDDFKGRLARIIENSSRDKSINIIFWLMEDGSIFNVTDISPEGKWFYQSKGKNGRMADGTDLDYTTFLNDWKRLARN